MSIVVEHEKRRKKILKKALDIFIAEGFENTTFQKIAARCGITRTTLYIYFKNKREIFNYSIKLLLTKVEDDIKIILKDSSLDSPGKIIKVLYTVFQHLEENRRLLLVILNYLLYLSKSNTNTEERIRRRTLRMRRTLTAMMIAGVKSGELQPMDIKTAGDFLYSFFEAAVFRLVVLQGKTVGDLKKTAAFAVKQLAAAPRRSG